jgi:hypothetical protein
MKPGIENSRIFKMPFPAVTRKRFKLLNFHIHKPLEAGFARKPNPKSEFCKTKKLKIDINRINIKL